MAYLPANLRNDLARVMSQGGEAERQAAALALDRASSPRADEILEAFPDMVARIAEVLRSEWD